jgi:hypothetical protein
MFWACVLKRIVPFICLLSPLYGLQDIYVPVSEGKINETRSRGVAHLFTNLSALASFTSKR